MAAVYAILGKFVLHDPRKFYDIAFLTLKNTTLILLLPYTVLWLYFAYKEKPNSWSYYPLQQRIKLPPIR